MTDQHAANLEEAPLRPPSTTTLTDLASQAMARDDWAGAEAYGAQLDAAEAARPVPQLPSSALWYAEQGHPVFPLLPGTKRPWPRSRGCLDATTDADRIRSWWSRWPDSNIGLATGHTVDVVDIDGPVGVRSRLDHWNDFAELPLVGLVCTPRPGGMHLYVTSSGEGNRAGLLPGIDYRGHGGYVVAPPSRISKAADPDLKHEGDYHWLAPLGALHATCRLHGDALRPDACWTCQQLAQAA